MYIINEVDGVGHFCLWFRRQHDMIEVNLSYCSWYVLHPRAAQFMSSKDALDNLLINLKYPTASNRILLCPTHIVLSDGPISSTSLFTIRFSANANHYLSSGPASFQTRIGPARILQDKPLLDNNLHLSLPNPFSHLFKVLPIRND